MLRRGLARPAKLDYARPDRAAGDPQFDRRVYRVGDWVFVLSLLAICHHRLLARGRAHRDGPAGLWGDAVRRLGGRPRPRRTQRRNARRVASRPVVVPRPTCVDVRRQHSLHQGRAHAGQFRLDCLARSAGRQAAARRSRPSAPPSQLATRPSRTSRRCTCCSSMPAPSAGAATRRVPRPRQVGLCHHAMWCSSCGNRPTRRCGLVRRRCARPVGRPRRRPTRRSMSGVVGHDGVRPETIWSCFQCNACVEICPVGIEQAPIINQLRRRLVEEGELDAGLADRRSRSSTSRATPSARSGAGAATGREELDFEVPGRAQGAGRCPLVRRRLRLLRSSLAGSDRARWRDCFARLASTSGSSTTANATPATTSAALARRACSKPWPSTTSATSAELRVSSGS